MAIDHPGEGGRVTGPTAPGQALSGASWPNMAPLAPLGFRASRSIFPFVFLAVSPWLPLLIFFPYSPMK